MGLLKKKFPKGRWVERRWVRDDSREKEGKRRGSVWTSGKFQLLLCRARLVIVSEVAYIEEVLM